MHFTGALALAFGIVNAVGVLAIPGTPTIPDVTKPYDVEATSVTNKAENWEYDEWPQFVKVSILKRSPAQGPTNMERLKR
jgi:hypothetical protein